jgi:hypothetical protein
MSIPGSASPLFFQAAAADAAAAGPIKSLRFNHSDSAYLERNFGSAGNQRTFTISLWFKNTLDSNGQRTFFTAQENSPFKDKFTKLWLGSGHTLHFDERDGGSDIWELNSTALFRDPSAWYHLVARVDTTQSTAADRVRLYVNGTQITDFSSAVYPSQNALVKFVNVNNAKNFIGRYLDNSYEYLDAYVADIYFIDGLSLDPTSFGAFDDNGVWQAATYSGTYGTNGYHLLDFANESTVGHDSSGNNNDFTANNILTSVTTYSTLGSFSASGSQVGGPLSYAYDSSTGTVGGSTSGITMWGRSGGTATQSGLSIPVTSSVVVYYNVNVSGASISLNGSSKSAGVPSGGNTTIGTLTWSASDLSNTLTSISISSPNLGVGVYVPAIQVDGSFLTDQSARDLDVLFDVPTNGTQSDTGAGGEVSGNYPLLNPSFGPSTTTLSNGNLEYTNSARHLARSTIATPQSGKWYFEAEVTGETTGGGDHGVGLIVASESDSTAGYVGQLSTAYGYYGDGNKYNNGSGSSYGSSFGPGDIIGCAFDADGGNLYFYKNGVAQNSGTAAFTGLTDEYFFAIENGTGGTMAVNFGQRAFAYSAPSGYKTLCTTNFPTPTIADGSAHFDAKTYTGNGGTNAITGLEFSPSLVWIKSRGNNGSAHFLSDVLRGGTSVMKSDSTSTEFTRSDHIQSFDSNGFTLGADGTSNLNNDSLVAWCWAAGSSTVSNTDGNITTSLRANATAGFSIATYSGSGTNGDTIGHGLGVQPDFCVVKARNKTDNWRVYHSALGTGYTPQLDSNGAVSTGANWQSISSTTLGLQSDPAINGSGYNYLAFFFAAVAGYSAFGSYSGTGSGTTSAYNYCGFRPRLVVVKRTDSTSQWSVYDTARNPHNAADKNVWWDTTEYEYTSNVYKMDIYSNGFKMRNSHSERNASGGTYIWLAFAENPFQANGGLAR